jgi:hypothetical protein
MEPDLRDLLAAWLSDADPGAERREALLTRLRADAAFRRAFLDEIRLLGQLRVVQSAEPRWLRLEDVCGWSRPAEGSATLLADQVVRSALRRARQRRLLNGALAAAAVLLAFTALAILRPQREPQPPPASHLEIATAIQIDHVRWDAEGDLFPEEGAAVKTGRLRLQAGKVTLAFFNGVILSVEGPADLDLHSLDRIVCRQGKLRGVVPAGAEGFTVAAPGYEVIDLETEFGLNVAADRTADLCVFDGSAAVSLLDSQGRSVRGAHLVGGQEVVINPDAATIREAEARPDRFIAFSGLLPQELELSPAYRSTVLASRPHGYWRFERVVDGVVANEVPLGPGLRVRGGVRLAGDAGGNHWAHFQASNPKQSLLMDGDWSPPRRPGYAIEVWVQSDALGRNALVSLIDRTDTPEEHHVSLLELIGRGERTPFEPCAVRFLDRWPPGEQGGANVFSRRTFVPVFWHHVVGQKAGGMMELYLDGRLVGSSPAMPDSADPAEVTTPCRLLVGRLKEWPLPDRGNQIRPFEGRIDELAVYERPLTGDEVRRHAKLRTVKSHE